MYSLIKWFHLNWPLALNWIQNVHSWRNQSSSQMALKADSIALPVLPYFAIKMEHVFLVNKYNSEQANLQTYFYCCLILQISLMVFFKNTFSNIHLIVSEAVFGYSRAVRNLTILKAYHATVSAQPYMVQWQCNCIICMPFCHIPGKPRWSKYPDTTAPGDHHTALSGRQTLVEDQNQCHMYTSHCS